MRGRILRDRPPRTRPRWRPCLGGEQLGDGVRLAERLGRDEDAFVNRPELTAERFVPDTWASSGVDPGAWSTGPAIWPGGVWMAGTGWPVSIDAQLKVRG